MKWEEPVLIRFIRLQGKRLVESVYDPVLNSIFLAWDVIVPNYARVEWEEYREERLILDPAYNHRLKWKEIAPRPKDVSEAWAVLYAIVDEHVGRLEELLAQNEAIETIEDPTWRDRAAMDCSAAFERHRRYQSAKTRELHKTLDTLCKLRKAEFGMEGVASGQWPVASEGEGQMTDGQEEVASGEWRVASEDEGMSGEWPVASEGQVAKRWLAAERGATTRSWSRPWGSAFKRRHRHHKKLRTKPIWN